MRTKILRSALLVILAAAVSVPASAGPHAEQVAVVRGGEIKGTVRMPFNQTAAVKVFIREVQFFRYEGQIRLVPTPPVQVPGTPNADQPLPAFYEGCITIKYGSATDSGCRVLGPAITVENDPLFQEGSIVFTVASKKHEGRKLSATIQLAATGTPGAAQGLNPPVVTPGPPADNYVSAHGTAGVERTMNVLVGTVRSEVLGGGAIIATQTARMFQGIQYDFDGNTTCPIFLGAVFNGCAV